ncbi:MAG: trehalose-phosphatase [Bryobacteraceae bacterium]
MSKPLFDRLREVETRIRAAGNLFLFLDFDGTLAPIVEEPEKARLPERTREVLNALASRQNVALTFVSGRSIEDIERRVGIPEAIYAGNHGIEIRGGGLSFLEPRAAERREDLATLSCGLAGKLRHIAGAFVENKGLTSSVHYRRVKEADIEEVGRVVRSCVQPLESLFEVRPGKKSFEVRPRVPWHKGAAVQWLLNRRGDSETLPLYFGDDQTDEDAFAVLRDGITVRVGEGRTLAHYRLTDPLEVSEFLCRMSGWIA